MSAAIRREPRSLAGRSALVIDDSTYMRRLVRSLLQQFGFEDIQEASNGSAALTMIAETPFDLVVCDWMMEPTDGYAFVRSLRQHALPGVRTLPVVMLTAVAEQNKVVAARDAGVTEYLVKPVSSGKLRARVASALTRPRPFVVSEGYVGPDRRRRDGSGYTGARRRLSDRLVEMSDDREGAGPEWSAAVAEYPAVLRRDIAALQRMLTAIGPVQAATYESWQSVHRMAHDIKGQAPSFGQFAAAEIAGSLERLLRPAIRSPGQFALSTERRLKAARTHADALALVVEQGIAGRSAETDALVERLNRAVERVHRESAG